ncbi:FAD-dependent oxidoreductase, partial [Nonomuraea sp. 10N515B]|uniref:FAD-dependent oxidoreductase n=1 Tax=Nonomuraea sp. 10N515B TaxID=3457422 RepID=UPI003FCEA581
MSTPASVLIVGASAAGLSTAEALRRHGYQGRLSTDAQLEALRAEFVLGEPAVALDAAARAVTTASGRVLRGDAVVIATGLTPCRPPGQDGQNGQHGLAGVHVLRGLDDALALRHDLTAAERLVVVGEGVLGAETAAGGRTNATEQAEVVAANILGADRPYTPIPYFWTDQYSVKIQVHGLPSAAAELD